MSHLVRTVLPKRYRNWEIKDLVGATNVAEIQAKVTEYITNPRVLEDGNNLCIFSPGNGNGKSIIASYIANQLHQPRLDEEGKLIIVPFGIMKFGEYLISRTEFSAENTAIRKFVMTVPILVLDDVSPTFCSGNRHTDSRELTLLMSHRREDMSLTIITSNLTPSAFEKNFSMTTASKVLENFSYIEVQGKDVRTALYPDQFETNEE